MTTATCGVKAQDDVWRNKHQCDKPAGHEGDHWCFCGHTWPNPTGGTS